MKKWNWTLTLELESEAEDAQAAMYDIVEQIRESWIDMFDEGTLVEMGEIEDD